MSDLAKKALVAITELAQSASARLDTVDLEAIPDSVQRRVTALWEERAEFVAGIQDLVRGLSNLGAILESVQTTQANQLIRLDTLETQIAVLRGSHKLPPPPPPLSEDICLEEDMPVGSARS